MSITIRRATIVSAVCGAGLLLATGYTIASSRPAAGTAPLRGATAVKEPAPCHGYKTYGVPRVAPLNPHKTYRATVTTNKGVFTITFLATKAPVTVQSFIFLAQHNYFNGVPFHRIIPGFVIQGGDPTGTGYCGPGYEFGTENTHPPYLRGTVAMARTQDPHSNGSQFFIVLKDHVLDQSPDYSIFGQVTSGMSTVDRIASVPRGYRDLGGGQKEQSVPLVKVYMKSVRITVS